MQFLDKWERKFGWISFPGFFRYYAIFHVLVYLLQFVSPGIGQILDFNRDKILAGEVWRLVTFLFASSGMGGFSPIGAMFLFCMASLAFTISDMLEASWDIFRTSVFFYVGYMGLIIANFLYVTPMNGSGFYIYMSTFIAFATLFPKFELRIFFIIPVEARWLAILSGVIVIFEIIFYPPYLGYVALCFANYFLWAGIPALRGQGRLLKAGKRRRRFQKDSSLDEDTFHRCSTCGRTELSAPALEFRIAMDGKEYCTDHLND
jgi:hypothetical protein